MGCLSSPGVRERGVLASGSGDQAGASCQLPFGLEFRILRTVKGEVENKKGKEMTQAAPQRESEHAGFFVLRL